MRLQIYCGDFGEYVVPAEIVVAALGGNPPPRGKWTDRRTRFAKAIIAWGRWMDYCKMVRAQ